LLLFYNSIQACAQEMKITKQRSLYYAAARFKSRLRFENMMINPKYIRQIIFFAALCSSRPVIAQQINLDSLKIILSEPIADTSRLHTLEKLCAGFFETYAWDSIAHYARLHFTLAKKINEPREIALAYKSLGYSDYGLNNFQGAFQNFSNALQLMKQVNDRDGIAVTSWLLGKINYQLVQYTEALKNVKEAMDVAKDGRNRSLLAGCYYDQGLYYEVLHDYPQSLKNYYQALRMFEQLGTAHYGGDKYYAMLSNTYTSMGNVYILQENNVEALRHLKLALAAREKSSRKNGLGYISNCIGEVYFKQGNYAMALQKQFEALKLWNKYADLHYQSWALPHTYRNIGHVYKKMGELALQHSKRDSAEKYLSLALKNYTSSLDGYTNAADNSGIPAAHINLGRLYLLLNDQNKARNYLKNGLQLSKAAGDKESARDGHLTLYQLDSAQGNFIQALLQYQQYILYRDSLLGEEAKMKSEGYKLQYEFDKKEEEIKILASESKFQALQVKQQKQQKNMLYAGVIFLVLVACYTFYRFNKKKKVQALQSMVNERLRISSELHDEVGATLSGISMYSHLVKEQMKSNNTTGIENSLQVMQQSSSQMVDKLNDIVWLINPEKDSLQQLISRLDDYAIKMAAVKDIKVNIKTPEKVADIALPAGTRRNIYLFCKEAINNAVKHSHATVLDFSVIEFNNLLQIVVADNGVGFDALQPAQNNGLANMRKRAAAIGGNMQLTTDTGSGTTIQLSLNITP
jgi:signal transduction histidine kinase